MRDEVASRVPYLSSRTDGHPPAWICNAVEPRPRPRHRSPRPEKGLAHLDPSACAGLGHAPTHTLRMCGDHHPSPAHAPHHNRQPLHPRMRQSAAPLVDQTLCRPRSSRHPPQCCPHPRLSLGEFASLRTLTVAAPTAALPASAPGPAPSRRPSRPRRPRPPLRTARPGVRVSRACSDASESVVRSRASPSCAWTRTPSRGIRV